MYDPTLLERIAVVGKAGEPEIRRQAGDPLWATVDNRPNRLAGQRLAALSREAFRMIKIDS